MLDTMRETQPRTGPTTSLGYSFGGLLAYEIAGRLREAGEQVAWLGHPRRLHSGLGTRHILTAPKGRARL
jgi:thioesterase domain-containing protein